MGSSKNSDNVSEDLAQCEHSAYSQQMLMHYPFSPNPHQCTKTKEIYVKYRASLVQAYLGDNAGSVLDHCNKAGRNLLARGLLPSLCKKCTIHEE